MNNSSRQTAQLESALREASERYDELCVSQKRLQCDLEQVSSQKRHSDQLLCSVQQENVQLNKECQELKDNINVMYSVKYTLAAADYAPTDTRPLNINFNFLINYF